MALTLGMNKGEDFYVGDTRMVVDEVMGATQFKLRVEGPAMDYRYEITDRRAEEVMKNVTVSAGLPHNDGTAAVVIDAPRNVKILRGKLYREEVAP